MLTIWNRIAEELEAGRRVFLAVVVGHEKGSPGTAGAQLLITENGKSFGTIGGGVMESRITTEAQNALKQDSANPSLRVLEHKDSGKGERSGLICGGAESLVTVVLGSESKALVEQVLDRLRHGTSGSIVFSAAGLTLEEEDLNQPSAFANVTENGWTARLGLFNRRRILVVGCGHCGAALAKQMFMLGFHVTVVDPRTDLATTLTLPAEVSLQERPFAEAGREVDHARLTFAIVMTPSYPDDIDALASILLHAFPFIGVMGSPVKLKKIKDELLNRGFCETDWDRLTAPVGLPIGSDTPEEIAVSVAAQILKQFKLYNYS